MPNWCTNILGAFAQDGQQTVIPEQYLDNKTGSIDFNKIVPRPDILNKVTTGGCRIDGEYVTRWVEEPIGEDKTKARKLTPDEEAQIKALGCESWWDWSIDNWGTKWNACEGSSDGYWQFFDTAWSPPSKVIEVLSKKHPELIFYLGFDEPGCDFAGYELYHNGEQVMNCDLPPSTCNDEDESESSEATDLDLACDAVEAYVSK